MKPEDMKHKKTIALFLLLATIVILLQNCSQSGPCEGSLTLENPIPDTTVAVDDTIYISLSEPPVFNSTEDRITYSYNVLSGITNADLAVLTGYKNEIKLDSLEIIGKEPGDAIIELLAKSGCLESDRKFNINVILI